MKRSRHSKKTFQKLKNNLAQVLKVYVVVIVIFWIAIFTAHLFKFSTFAVSLLVVGVLITFVLSIVIVLRTARIYFSEATYSFKLISIIGAVLVFLSTWLFILPVSLFFEMVSN